MAKTDLPAIEFLRECFSYDPETGELRWRHRPDYHFATPAHAQGWNTRYAGLEAGAIATGPAPRRVVGLPHRIGAHRIAYALHHGVDPGEVDHVNGNPLDNRICNLRQASRQENNRNRAGKRARHLPKGVFGPKNGKFVASATVGGKTRQIGRFNTPAEAHGAWKAWAAEAHGEYFNPGPEKLTVYD